MLTHGKLPITFEASSGTAQVKSLIEQVTSLEQASSDNPVR
jgi:hypothetical protein